jgi:hypothetical protein
MRGIVASWFAADETKITQVLKDGLLIEVRHGSKSKKGPRKEGQ